MLKINLATQEPMGPHGIDRKGSSQEGNLPLGIGATQIDHLPPRVGLQIQRPVGWEWTPWRACSVLRDGCNRRRETAPIGSGPWQVGMVKALQTLACQRPLKCSITA